MSKKQTRRSISVSGDLYDRLRTYCDANGATCSGVVEELLRSHLGMEERAPNLKRPPVQRVERSIAPPPVPSQAEMVARADRLTSIKQVAAEKAEPILVAKTVTVTTPVLEKNGNWEKKPTEEERAEKLRQVDAASKIFTF